MYNCLDYENEFEHEHLIIKKSKEDSKEDIHLYFNNDNKLIKKANHYASILSNNRYNKIINSKQNKKI
jgi:hypothetical protein